MNMLNTIHDMEFGNYCLIESKPFIPKLTNEDFRRDEIRKVFFDDAKSKNGARIKIVLINPTSKVYKFSYKLT